MWKWHPPDPNDERFKGLRVTVIGKRIEIEFGPEWEPPKELKLGRPIPDEDKR